MIKLISLPGVESMINHMFDYSSKDNLTSIGQYFVNLF